jgi:hypothetical protein
MFMRRRPLLRAAVVGGGAYLAGKKSGQRQADQGYQGNQNYQEAQPAAGQQAASASPGTASIPDQLNKLTALHEQGALSDTEFASAKAKLLGA